MKNLNKKTISIVSAAVASLLVLSGAAHAAPPGSHPQQPPAPTQQPAAKVAAARRGALLNGKVSVINGSTLTLSTPAPRLGRVDVAITVTSSTAYYAPGIANATLANVQAGNRVVVLLDKTASIGETRVAAAVTVLPLPQSVIVGGQVSNVSGATFALSGKRGNSGAINADGAKIVVPGKPGATLADLKNGDRVVLQGVPSGESSVDADVIVVVTGSRDNIATGAIASINGNSLVLFARNGQRISVDAANAVIVERGTPSANLNDLKVGSAVAVIGVKNADGSLTAQLIGQAKLPFFNR